MATSSFDTPKLFGRRLSFSTRSIVAWICLTRRLLPRQDIFVSAHPPPFHAGGDRPPPRRGTRRPRVRNDRTAPGFSSWSEFDIYGGNNQVNNQVSNKVNNKVSNQDNSQGSSEGSGEDYFERNSIRAPPIKSRRILKSSNASEAHPSSVLRQDLLRDYDKGSFPWEYAWESQFNQMESQGSGLRLGLPVELGINFHRVFDVNILNSVIDLVVWFRLTWVDPRLTWDPAEYGNLTRAWFFIGDGVAGGETSEIWTPDVELWNLKEGLQDSLVDAYATVTNDGVVFWSRPGHLRPSCKFVGLDRFPFDRLTCTMEFGSWVYNGLYMRINKFDQGYTIGGSETAGESYNEYAFAQDDPVSCASYLYPPFPVSPEEDWPVLLYNVTIVRSWQPYVRGYVTTQILLTVIAFSAFWLPPPCGERMGLSITALLASVASEIVISDNLPASAELTWFQMFSLMSLFFSTISLLVNVIVLYFYYKRSKNMIPWWYIRMKEWLLARKAPKTGVRALSRIGSTGIETVSHLGETVKAGIGGRTREDEDETNNPEYPLPDTKLSIAVDDTFKENGTSRPYPRYDDFTKPNIEVSKSSSHQDKSHTSNKTTLEHPLGLLPETNDNPKMTGAYLADDNSISSIDTPTIAYHRNSDIDPTDGADTKQHRGVIEIGPLSSSLTSKLSGKSMDDVKSHDTKSRGILRSVDYSVETKYSASQDRPKIRITESSSMRLKASNNDYRRSSMIASKNSDNRSLLSLAQAPRDADDFNNEDEVESNQKWKEVAARIDDVARFWIPFAFVIALSIVLSRVF